MKLRWTDKELDYFRKSTKQTDDVNELSWWAIFGTVVLMEVIFVLKIVEVI